VQFGAGRPGPPQPISGIVNLSGGPIFSFTQRGRPRFGHTGRQTWSLPVGAGLAPDPETEIGADKTGTAYCPTDFQFETDTEHYLSVDEGYFDDDGKFVTVTRRNGGAGGIGAGWVERTSVSSRVLLFVKIIPGE